GVVAGRLEQAALVASLVDEHLPCLAAAGWSETQTLLALFGDDPGALQHDLAAVARALPLDSRPCTLPELKALAGDWFAPGDGRVTIGWAATELAAEPRADWARAILEEPALAALPLTIALHLGPQRDFPEPAAGLRRDLAALDARIEARRRAGWRAGSRGSRPDLVAG